jgi:hypothetical protein
MVNKFLKQQLKYKEVKSLLLCADLEIYYQRITPIGAGMQGKNALLAG